MRYLLILLACLPFLTAHAEEEGSFVLAMRMYGDQRAYQVGDLLTIVVDEAISTSSKDSLATSKSATAKADAPILGDPNSQKLQEFLQSLRYQLAGSSEFSGTGSQNMSEELAARFTVRVVDTMGSGVLLLQGERLLKLKDESVKITLSGLVRSRDVNADNTIASSRISDARIVYERSGEVSRGARPGWLWSLFQRISPW